MTFSASVVRGLTTVLLKHTFTPWLLIYYHFMEAFFGADHKLCEPVFIVFDMHVFYVIQMYSMYKGVALWLNMQFP